MGVARLAHDAVEDELGRDVGVDHSNDQSGNNDECEGGLLVRNNTQTPECWCGGVLSKISESNGRGNDEQQSGDACQDSQGLGEVLWPFHLADKSWEENLRNF
jgi:hypothetical protein